VVDDDARRRKQAEMQYPSQLDASGRAWLRTKPFGGPTREAARHVVDVGYVLELTGCQPGLRVCELGCGSGWLASMLAEAGADVTGLDISPEMIEVARERPAPSQGRVRFEACDMERLPAEHHGRYDVCLTYDSLHHSPHAELVVRSAFGALIPGGTFVLAEPNWKHRFQGREAADAYGVTEMGYSPRRLKRVLRQAGFEHVERFHNNRKRLYSNRPGDVLAHLAEPFAYRLLAPFWTQIWLRARRP
jgi:2-polyprenyl-3-methyl-5-hydroxy-6-metoxy-1,4-benzoquinol methylase